MEGDEYEGTKLFQLRFLLPVITFYLLQNEAKDFLHEKYFQITSLKK